MKGHCGMWWEQKANKALPLRVFQANLKCPENRKVEGLVEEDVHFGWSFLINKRRKKEAVEARGGYPWGQVMNKAGAESGERGKSQGESQGLMQTHKEWGAERSPRRLGPQGTNPAHLWHILWAWNHWGQITIPDTTRTSLILRKGLSSALLIRSHAEP